VSAADVKVKWNQNKLKTEQDAHKVCSSSTKVLAKYVYRKCVIFYCILFTY